MIHNKLNSWFGSYSPPICFACHDADINLEKLHEITWFIYDILWAVFVWCELGLWKEYSIQDDRHGREVCRYIGADYSISAHEPISGTYSGTALALFQASHCPHQCNVPVVRQVQFGRNEEKNPRISAKIMEIVAISLRICFYLWMWQKGDISATSNWNEKLESCR